jgi:hypothetical protein
MLKLTEYELATVVTAETFRELELCVSGSKEYGARIGLDFKDLVKGKLTVRHFIHAMERMGREDQNILNVINKTLGK